MIDRQSRLTGFIAGAGWGDASRAALAGDASTRRYERLRRGKESAILMDAPPGKGQDVRPFLRIGAHLRSLSLSAPQVLAEDAAQGFLLLEDMGDALFSRVAADTPKRQDRIYSAATDVLALIGQHPPLPGLVALSPALAGQMTGPAVTWYARGITGQTGGEQAGSEQAGGADDLSAMIEHLGHTLLAGPQVLMLRDYHAENLIWLPERSGAAQVGLLDFQDAMTAHPAYDLVSLLQDARRDVPTPLEAAMLARYIATTGQEAADFTASYALLGAQRNLRILGVFARLCMHFGKVQYVALIPRVWSYLARDLAHPALAPLSTLVAALLPDPTPERLHQIARQCGTFPMP